MGHFVDKQPNERLTVSVDLTARLLSGVTISSVAASAVVFSTGVDATSDVLQSTTGAVSGNYARITLKSGQTTGTKYRVKILATLSNSDILEEDLDVEIVEE